MPPLRGGEDSAVADRAHGTEDAVQRVRGQVQVGSAGAGIPARSEPHLRVDAALQLASKGDRAEAAEGVAEGGAGASAVTWPLLHHRCAQRPRSLLDRWFHSWTSDLGVPRRSVGDEF